MQAMDFASMHKSTGAASLSHPSFERHLWIRPWMGDIVCRAPLYIHGALWTQSCDLHPPCISRTGKLHIPFKDLQGKEQVRLSVDLRADFGCSSEERVSNHSLHPSQTPPPPGRRWGGGRIFRLACGSRY